MGNLSKSVLTTYNLKPGRFPTGTKNSNTHFAWHVQISRFVNVAKCAHDQCSIF